MATLETSQVGGVTVVRLSGEMTQSGVSLIHAAFDAAVSSSDGVVIDLSGVTLMTTPGITIILAALDRLREQNRRLIFTGIRGALAELLLTRCRLDLVLTIAPTVDAATAAAKSGSAAPGS
jgi:anti-anti-sigma factor